MFEYTIVMKNGVKYNVKADQTIDELMKMLIPKSITDINLVHFFLADKQGYKVTIIGSEVSSVEFV